MPNANDIATQVGNQVAKTIRRAEDVVVDSVKSWSETVERLVPEIKIPLGQSIPTAKAAVATAFGVTQQVVEAQRDFVLNLLDNVEERFARSEDQAAPAAKTSAKPAPKAEAGESASA